MLLNDIRDMWHICYIDGKAKKLVGKLKCSC